MKTPVLFLCERNAARSVMAQALLPGSTSAGISPDPYVDPFAAVIMAENDIDISTHEPRSLTEADLKTAGTIVALSMEAFEAARARRGTNSFELEYWDLPSAPSHDAPRDQILEGYRHILRALREHLAKRF